MDIESRVAALFATVGASVLVPISYGPFRDFVRSCRLAHCLSGHHFSSRARAKFTPPVGAGGIPCPWTSVVRGMLTCVRRRSWNLCGAHPLKTNIEMPLCVGPSTL
jgi:hypothetical protein